MLPRSRSSLRGCGSGALAGQRREVLHPQFDAFLRHALGNSKPLNDFLRRAAFERLPGSTESKVFLNLDDEGVGNTGKTTLLHCMRIVWGDYAVMVADLFLASRHGTMSSNQESEWALTEGTRLVVSDEISAGPEIASARIERITSGMVAGEVSIRQK